MTDALDMLREIPHLATEAWLTRNHPNPGEESGRPVPGDPTTRCPVNLVVLVAFTPDPDARSGDEGVSLTGRLALAVRATWEDARREGVDLPPLSIEPTFATDCDWLLRTAVFWTSDPWLAEYVTEQVDRVHSELQRMCRAPRPPLYSCPDCEAPMRAIPGGHMLACDEGHEHPADLERQWRRRPPLPASLIAQTMGVSEERLRQWKHRRKIKPVRADDGRDLFFPWDVLLLAHPDIAEAYARRDAG